MCKVHTAACQLVASASLMLLMALTLLGVATAG